MRTVLFVLLLPLDESPINQALSFALVHEGALDVLHEHFSPLHFFFLLGSWVDEYNCVIV